MAGIPRSLELRRRQAPGLPFAVRAVVALAGGAWLVSLALELTGRAGALHHHALIEPGAPPLWLGIPLFLVAWQVMVAAMMLPASARAIAVVTGSRIVTRQAHAFAGFLGAYALVWSAFGVAAFVGDMGLHALVHTSAWLAARPWLIQASVLALAGAWQLVPVRRRALEACRHPARRVGAAITGGSVALPGSADLRAGFRSGLAHGLDCLVASWAVMLLMFAAGVANLAWMAVLAAAMAYEALGRHGARFGILLGFALLDLAAIAATGVVLGF